ncbi:MAG: RNA polymerase sigma factor [Chloroflexota bacterium]
MMLGRAVREEVGAAPRSVPVEAQSYRAFADLYDQYAALTFALAVRMLKDRTVAMEMVEAVFNDLRQIAPGGQHPNPRAWLLAATHRRCTHWRKVTAGKGNHISRPHDPVALLASDSVEATNPVSRTVAHMNSALVHAGARSLPEEQHRILEMAYFEGMNCVQIADRLGLLLGEVNEHLRSGLQSLVRVVVAPPAS